MGQYKTEEVLSKKQLAYNGIKSLIVKGEVKKDSPLVERQLCDLLGISRTPIREALRALANEGLVEIVDGKGVYVKKIDFRDMIEIFEVREALECMAVRLFVERMDDTMSAMMEQYLKSQEEAYEADNHELFMEMDMAIHHLIAEGSQNVRLKNAISNIYEHVSLIAISVKDDKIIREIAMRGHKSMWEAIK